jgi:hypothetical protein
MVSSSIAGLRRELVGHELTGTIPTELGAMISFMKL